MFPSSILRAAKGGGTELPSFDFEGNPFKTKRTWPPDFEKLSERHQFRLERRYKRRAKLKWARPKLMVATKLAQWGGCTAVAAYLVLFMDWGDDRAFKGVRDWYKETTDSMFQRPRRPQSSEHKASQQPS